MSCASQPPDHFETTVTVYGLIQPARFPRKTKHAVVFYRRCVPRKVRATCLDSYNAFNEAPQVPDSVSPKYGMPKYEYAVYQELDISSAVPALKNSSR